MTLTERSKKHPVTKTGIEGWYMYRGIRIDRDDQLRGYSGHWRCQFGSNRLGTKQYLNAQTRSQLLVQIDELLDAGPVVSEVSESYKIVSPKELRTFIDEWITNKDQNP